ncbi:MAG TPA: GAF domain-containing protein, partial [Pyrinomonadaceae bacterium]
MRDYEKALRLLDEGLTVTRRLKSLFVEASYLQALGRVALAQGKLKAARKYLQDSFKIAQQSSNEREISSILAWLAAVELAQGNEKAAGKTSAQAVAQLTKTENYAFDHPPQEVWWWRYRVLTKTKSKEEALEALQNARQLMLEQVSNISDEGLRRNYLNKVEINREIMLEWAKRTSARKVPLELPETHTGSLSGQIRRVTEIGLQLNEHHDESELLDLILDEVVELSGVERAILLLNDKRGELTPVAGYLLSEKALTSLATASADLTDRVARSRQPILFEEAAATAKKRPSYLQHVKLAVPLMLRGQLLGVLYADMRRLFGKLDDEDLNLLSVLCNQAASALENARLVSGLEQMVEQRTGQLNARVDELAILNSVGEAMAKTLDVRTVTKIVGDKVRDIFDAEAVSINLLEEVTKLIHPIYEYDEGEGGYIDY